MAKKKTTAKKSKAGSKAAPEAQAPPRPAAAFDIFGPEAAATARTVQAQLITEANRRIKNPRPASYLPALNLQLNTLDMPHLLPQWQADRKGYPSTGVVQFVGDMSCGKSTRAICDMGHIMATYNTPALYLACEGKDKMMDPNRMLRCMHHDPAKALKLMQVLQIEVCQSVVQLIPKLRSWARAWREAGVPRNIPLLGAIDPYSRLLSEAESMGAIEWDAFMKEAALEIGEGSKMAHAQNAHQLARWLQAFCEMYGVLLFVVHHRTEKVTFNRQAAQRMQNMSEANQRLESFAKIGGSALDGLAALTVVVTSTENSTDPVTKKVTGRIIRSRVSKQSHGVSERKVKWQLRMDHAGRDTPTYLDRPLSYAAGLAELLHENGLLGVKVGKEDGLVTCAELGLRAVDPDIFDRQLQDRPDLITQLGKDLRINGYVSLIQDVLAQQNAGV